MGKLCDFMELSFSENFIDTFSVFEVCGDGGRTSDKIESRPTLCEEQTKTNFKSVESYQRLAKQFGIR